MVPGPAVRRPTFDHSVSFFRDYRQAGTRRPRDLRARNQTAGRWEKRQNPRLSARATLIHTPCLGNPLALFRGTRPLMSRTVRRAPRPGRPPAGGRVRTVPDNTFVERSWPRANLNRATTRCVSPFRRLADQFVNPSGEGQGAANPPGNDTTVVDARLRPRPDLRRLRAKPTVPVCAVRATSQPICPDTAVHSIPPSPVRPPVARITPPLG